MKKAVVIIIVVILLFSIILASSKDSKVDEKIVKDLESKEKVRIIVRLEEVKEKQFFFFEKKLNETEKEKLKNVRKENLIKVVKREKIKHDFGDSLALEISKNDLKKLENEEGIKIEYDFPIRAFLQDSAVIVNATRSRDIQLSGINITGQGETICILDTGINYTHPDLGGCYGNNNISLGCKVVGGYDYANADSDPYDDHGHGTHVAGIAASNNSISGIAKDARIVAIKVLDANGNGASSDIKAGIDWCVNNASKFNISVISMSLGGVKNYTAYCDNVDDAANITGAVHNAILNNISVIAATGNLGNYTGIASPSCIRNVTAVGWANKDDSISGSSNRNNLTDFFAPGTNINSTDIDGTYELRGGTSMAAPHVAGGFALVRQFYRLQSNRVLTPLEIQSKFNETGRIINDTTSGLNFTRINIYAAILSLDETKPNVNLISPENNLATTLQNLTFSCNSTDLQLNNLTLFIWNSTGNYLENSTQIRGTSNSTNWNVTDLSFVSYNWNCLSCDTRNNCNFSSANYSLSIRSLITSLVSPANNTKTNLADKNFSCNATTQNSVLRNITFLLWNSSSLAYSENKSVAGIFNSSNFNFSFSVEGNYNWNCLVSNNDSLSYFAAANFSLTYDTTSPQLTVILPVNNTWHNTLKLNVTSNENLDLCWFSLNQQNTTMNRLNDTSFHYTNSSINETSSLANLTFYCNDTAGNLNYTAGVFFGIDKTSPNITLINPENGYSETASSTTISFQFNVTENTNINSCSLIINGSLNSADLNTSSITNSTNTIQKTLSAGSYNWMVNCTDNAVNTGNSSARSLVINSPPSTSSSGGGGGGASITSNKTAINKTSNESAVILNEKAYDIKVNEKVSFRIDGNEHLLQIVNISNDGVIINIYSAVQQFSLKIGEGVKVNLDEDNYYDLSVKLNSIINNSANISIIKIREEIMTAEKEENGTAETEQEQEKGKSYKWVIVIAVILVVLVIAGLILKKQEKLQEKIKEIIDKYDEKEKGEKLKAELEGE